MKSQHDLHQLIHILTKSEKRYFKLYNSKYHHKSKSNALKLFEAIEKQKDYDEKVLKEQFKKEKIAKNFAYEKNYLLRLLLRCLNDYHQQYSARSHIFDMLKQIEILYDRKHYKLASKLIKKAIKLANEGEYFELLYLLNHWQTRVTYLFLGSSAKSNSVFSLRLESESYLQNLVMEDQLQKLMAQLHQLHVESLEAKSNSVLKQMEKIMEDPLLKASEEGLTIRAKRYYNVAKQVYYRTKNDIDKYLECSKKLIDIFKQKPDYLRLNFSSYLSEYTNYITALVFSKKLDAARKELENFKTIPSQYKEQFHKAGVGIFFHSSRILSLEMAIEELSGNFQIIIDRLPQIQKDVLQESNKIDIYNLSNIYNYILFAYWATEKHDQTLDWIKRFFDEIDDDVSQGLQIQTRIISILTHYELNNESLIESQINSTYRYCKKMNLYGEYEQAVMTIMRKLKQNISKQEFNNFLKKQQDILRKIERPPSSLHFLVDHWIDSKLQQKTFGRVVKERFEKTIIKNS